MSLVVSWIGVDTHGTASAYIAGDSRISWNKSAHFDYGRKVYASKQYPELLGYCGDVLFPSIVVSQVFEMIDRNVLINEKHTCKQKYEIVKNKILSSFKSYPTDVAGITQDQFQFIYITKETILKKPKFEAYLMDWKKGRGWRGKEVALPNKSSILYTLGSGSIEYTENYKRYEEGPTHGTSRAVFHCFCDTLSHIRDPNCGGAPQIVGIYRKPESSAIDFGVIYKNNRYFLGKNIEKASYLNNIEWRNRLFEICDGLTKKPKPGVARQPDILKRD